jgi:glucose-1-phosphate cytidylyltransferase
MTNRGVPTIILCGGRGTRIREVSTALPKPMIPIGNRPILWHVMKIYAASDNTDFRLALGYLGETIKEFFLHYEAMTCDFQIELGSPNSISYIDSHPERGWSVACIDTGLDSLTGTRVRAAARGIEEGPVMVTYGDCVGDIDVARLLEFHRGHGRLATMTAVHPPGRFGELSIADDRSVRAFEEKPQTSSGAINGGFMVLEREAIDHYIPADRDVMLEREPLSGLAADGQLVAYEHDGFWQPMDTPREQELLSDLWSSGKAPWKVWS